MYVRRVGAKELIALNPPILVYLRPSTNRNVAKDSVTVSWETFIGRPQRGDGKIQS